VTDPKVTVDDVRVRQVGFETLMAEADYVVRLAVVTAETESLINRAALARMKPDAVLINLSRGNLVDEPALVAALTEGRLAGGAMDVGHATDQMPSPEFARLPR
jgi:D-3-phosphoglycerate dehydrogenase